MGRDKKFRQFSDYEGGMPPEAFEFVEWLITPPSMREPSTLTEFGQRIAGCSNTVLRNWQRKPVFVENWKRRAAEVGYDESLKLMLMEALHVRAMNGDNQASKLWMEASGNLAAPDARQERNQASSKELKPEEMSDEQVEAALAEMIEDQ